MIRKLSLLVLATALIVSACGRQVTPDRAGTNGAGLSAGFMQVKYRTLQPFDFTNVRYVIAFNTSGTGGTPYAPNAYQTNFPNYSFEFIIYGAGGGTYNVVLYQFVRQTVAGGGTTVTPQIINYNAALVNFNPNSNGQGTEFTLTFSRTLFYGIFTPSPSPSPTLSPTPSPTPVGATPSPSPSGSPTAAPTQAPPFSNIWYWNFFTAQPPIPGNIDQSAQTLDAFSTGGLGPSDNSSVLGPLDITTTFDLTYNASVGPTITPASAQITGAEFLNAP
jgi:hypothetical protein